jgi:hypothetical protein
MPKHSIDQSAAHAEAEMQAFLDASSGESHFEPVAETPSATEGSGDDPYDKELFEATWAVQSDPDAEPITNGEMTQFLTKAGITAEKMPAYKAFVAKQFSEDPKRLLRKI